MTAIRPGFTRTIEPASGRFGSVPGLAPERSPALVAYQDETTSLDQRAFDYLLQEVGTRPLAVGTPWAVKMTRVLFQPDGTFIPCPIGEFAYAFLAGYGESADVAAWSPASDRVATCLGQAALIGEEQVTLHDLGSLLRGQPLPVWRSPAGWLQANRHGVVIADHRLAGHLLSERVLVAEDSDHRRDLCRRLRVELPRVIVRDEVVLADDDDPGEGAAFTAHGGGGGATAGACALPTGHPERTSTTCSPAARPEPRWAR
jgi:hypothetical protein